MSTLRDEIAKIITPYGASGFEKADAVMALLRERGSFDLLCALRFNVVSHMVFDEPKGEWVEYEAPDGSAVQLLVEGLLDLGET